MKKILTSLMLITASFMLLFMVIPEPVHAASGDPVDYQFEFTTDGGFYTGYETDNYLFTYLEVIYRTSSNPVIEFDINNLVYTDISVTRIIDSDFYSINIATATNIYVLNVSENYFDPYINDGLPDNTYTLTITHIPETYQDLFYELIEVEIPVITMNSTDAESYQKILDVAIWNTQDEFSLPMTINMISYYVNDILIYDNYPSLDINNGSINLDDDSGFGNFYEDGSISFYSPLEVGDVMKLVFKVAKVWTQSHDYGRVRTNTSTLYLNQPSETAAFLSHSESTNVINVSNIAVGDEIIMQSPYSDFSVSYGNIGFPRTYLVEQENIAAVKMIKNAADNTDYTFVLYYWESGGVTSRVVSNVNLANRNSLNIKFDGGFRKALDNQDVMVANVDELTPLEDFLPYLTAFDAIDGDISDQIVIVDDGGYQPDVVDIYNVEFGVTNSNGLETTLMVPVYVADIVAPVITGVDTPVNISYDQSFNVTSWVNSLSVTDNYYTGLSISILNNSYSSNKTTVGTYEITVQAVDPSGNKGTLTRVINVTDGVGPEFSGIDTITASINENLTVEQIKAGLAAIDAIDGNVTASITVDSDNLTGNSSTPGTYEVIFMAVDSVENQTFHTVEVTIVTSPPGFYILNSNSIRLLPGASLSIEQILNLLGAVDASEVTTDYNANVPGTYNLSFTVNGESVSMSITVLGQNQSPIPTPEVPGTNVITNTNIYLTIGISVIALSAIAYVIYKKKKSV